MSEFIDVFKEQKQKIVTRIETEIMRKYWNRENFWYFQALYSPKYLFCVFNEYIQCIFCQEHCIQQILDRTVSPYWTPNTEKFIQAKIVQETEYKNQLRR
ncbi:uncharacterized protein N7469_000571 [Penicillium citrinum]|uniref:Uncharacterized protein n=2 Tax=Penicillium TaxID=5073 RepID=A0A9W9TVI2_PENCI|nr:uncharacterized protein N7469_000571 [Penicillium citrinum]KAJ5242244.1 hypothetical protein N7469_000571 [Penicillium citrinum]KAJ5600267.1 hypothetical protein N7450_001334 [Penicillium hetheringtonii]